MQTLKIEYIDGTTETIQQGLLLNAGSDDGTEYQIETEEGIRHIPYTSVKNLLEVQ